MKVQERADIIHHLISNLQEEPSENTNSTNQKQKDEKNASQNIVLRKINPRSFSSVHHIYRTLPSHHVYKLFNTFGINQCALNTPDFQQSFFRTYFYHRVVTRVERYSNAVVINIIPTCEQVNQPGVGYMIQKLKSMGTRDMYELATTIEELYGMLMELKNQKIQTIVREDKESIAKYLKIYGNQKFICKFGLYKMAISNSLLEFLGYDIQQFSIEAVKYRTILFDFLSSNSYYLLVSHALTTLKYLMQSDLNRITEQQYVRLSTLKFSDYVYSKNYKKSYCDLEYLIPAKGVLCIKIDKVISENHQFKMCVNRESIDHYSFQKKIIHQKEYQLLNKMEVVPSNWIDLKESKVAGYRSKTQKYVSQ